MDLKLTGKTHMVAYWVILIVAVVLAVLFVIRLQGSTKPPVDYMESGLAAYDAGEYNKAFAFFSQGDQDNNPQASFALGAMYMAGKGTPKDINLAMALYAKAADFGYAPAQLTIALLYGDGGIVPQNKEIALAYAQEAALNGDTEAQMLLASWYESDFFGKSDIREAIKWYTLAAKNGNIDAKMALAVIYHKGKPSFLPNIFTAKRWYDSMERQQRFYKIFAGEPLDKIPENPFKTEINLSMPLK